MRLDSAPSSVYKDIQGSNGGLNMALGGYLHSTLHSPSTKTKSHNQKFQNSNLYRQYSASTTVNNPIWNKFLNSENQMENSIQTPLINDQMPPKNSEKV